MQNTNIKSKRKIYLAAPLFNEAERAFNQKIAGIV